MSYPLPPLPPTNTTICVVIPDSEEWRQLYMGAIAQLTRWWYYDVQNADQAEDVVQRIMSCNYQTGQNFEECMDLDCNDILNCINDTPALQQAIAQFARGSSTSIDAQDNPTIGDYNVFGDAVVGACDDDNLFGAITGLVDLLNDLSVDILEAVSSAPNAIARLGDLVEAVPLLGEAPVDDILQFTESMANDFAQAYDTAWTVALRDDIRCELFCISRDTCELELSTVMQYYQDKIIASVNGQTMLTLIQSIISTNWIGEQSIYALHWILLKTMIFGGEVIGIDADRLVTMVSALFNDPDGDWQNLCLPCADTWSYSWLAGGTDGDPVDFGWQVVYGFYDAVNNIYTEEPGAGTTDFTLLEYFIPVGKNTTITGFSMSYDIVTPNARTQTLGVQDTGGINVESRAVSKNGTVVDNLALLNPVAVSGGYRLYVLTDCSNQSNPHHAYLTNIAISGTGVNPFV